MQRCRRALSAERGGDGGLSLEERRPFPSTRGTVGKAPKLQSRRLLFAYAG
jgi:hypothetical protein